MGCSWAQVWVKEEGHSSRRESLAPGAVLWTRKCISSARQGRQVFRGPVEVGQMVSWAEVERRLEHRGWVSCEEGILLGQEESPRGQWLVQPGGRSWWLGARLVGQQCRRAHVQQDTGFGAVPCGPGGHRRQHTALPSLREAQ